MGTLNTLNVYLNLNPMGDLMWPLSHFPSTWIHRAISNGEMKLFLARELVTYARSTAWLTVGGRNIAKRFEFIAS